MTVYQLFVYSCVTVLFPMGGDLSSKTCRWDARNYYSSPQRCEDVAPSLGQDVFSDYMENRKVEKSSCRPISVN